MSSLYCRKTRKWLLGLIPAEELKCDKEAHECLQCENFIAPWTLEDNTDQDEYVGALFRPM